MFTNKKTETEVQTNSRLAPREQERTVATFPFRRGVALLRASKQRRGKGQTDPLTFPDRGSDCRQPSEPGSCCGWHGCWPFP